MQKLPAFTRKKILNFCVDAFRARFEAFAYALCREAGKPIKDARGLVLATTLGLANQARYREIQGDVGRCREM